MRRLWLLSLVALAHCGGGATGDALTLVQPAGEVILEDAVTGIYDAALAGGNGHASYIWSEYDGESGFSLVSQAVTTDLALLGGREVRPVAANRSLRSETACYRGARLAVAWADGFFQLPSGITYDLSDVSGSFSWPSATPALIANVAELESQHRPSIACLADGGVALTWTNVCSGAERKGNGTFYFRPEHCDDLPPPGNYFRLFDSDGQPRSGFPLRIDGETYSPALVSALGNGGFFLFSGTKAQVRSADGELEQETILEGADSSYASVACSLRYCAIVSGGQALVFDSTDLRSHRTIVFQESSKPGPNETIEPRQPAIACDETETCVVAWNLDHVTVDYDVVETVSLGVFARAFELDSQRSGTNLRIFDPTEQYEDGVRLAATGPGEFLVAHSPEYGDVSLTRLSVQ